MLPRAIANYNRNNPDNRVIPVSWFQSFISYKQKQKEEKKLAEFEIFLRKRLKRVNSVEDSDYESEEDERPTERPYESPNERSVERRDERPSERSNERPIERSTRLPRIPKVANPRPSSASPIQNSQTINTIQARPNQSRNADDPRFNTLGLKCFVCPRYFPNKSHLDIHLEERHNLLQHRCFLKDCGKSFPNTIQLGRHLKADHQRVAQWKCKWCAKWFRTHPELYHHCRSIHFEGHFECSKCGRVEKQRSNAFNHYHKAHQQQ